MIIPADCEGRAPSIATINGTVLYKQCHNSMFGFIWWEDKKLCQELVCTFGCNMPHCNILERGNRHFTSSIGACAARPPFDMFDALIYRLAQIKRTPKCNDKFGATRKSISNKILSFYEIYLIATIFRYL